MKIQLAVRPLSQIKSDVIAVPVFEKDHHDFQVSLINEFLTSHPDFGKLFDTQLLFSQESQLLLVGAGQKDKFNFATLQNWTGAAAKHLLSQVKNAAVVIPNGHLLPAQDQTQASAIGIELAEHDPSRDYKTDSKKPKLTDIELVVPKNDPAYMTGLRTGQTIALAMNLVRQLGDTPANEMTPTVFLKTARKIALDNKLKITVLNETQAKKKGMNAFCGVAQGSQEPSFMIALEYTGNAKSKDKWGLVGKGITFDTGGISIKPAAAMHEMKYDMLGAATVLAAIQTLAKLKAKVNVVGVCAVTENLPGGRAQRPGDVIKSYSGKTVEVLNTDAEGRLVLIDGLTYAQKDFKATKLIDVATLTGAMIVALGNNYTGVFSNDPKFAQDLITAGAKVGEKYWQMPTDDDYNELIKSDIADLANVENTPRTAGSIAGAKFIEAVVENNRPWIHLDIAGTGWDTKPKPFRAPGATGVAVKTLVELISQN